MYRRTLVAGLVLLMAILMVGVIYVLADEITPEQEAWLKEAQIASYQPATEDWDAIYEAAKEEGKVVVYSLSSRIFDAVETFKETYPGVKVEARDMVSVNQIDKLTREQAAGVYNVDVLFLADVTTLMNIVFPQKLIWNYVPRTLLGGQSSEAVISENLREPLLVHSIEAKVIWYNYGLYPEAPIDNLWDLTRPEWSGLSQMKDPLISAENMNFLQTCVQHADKMAAAYEQEFGELIELSPGVENAGYEFILRWIRNDMVLTTSDGDAAKATGFAEQKPAPLAVSNASSKLRYNEGKGTKLAAAWDVVPKVGITKCNFLVMANQAPHPNAAKLWIRFMLGDEEGGAGMAPWLVPGGWASRSDVEPLIDRTVEGLAESTWFLDPTWLWDHGLEVRDFWLGK